MDTTEVQRTLDEIPKIPSYKIECQQILKYIYSRYFMKLNWKSQNSQIRSNHIHKLDSWEILYQNYKLTKLISYTLLNH